MAGTPKASPRPHQPGLDQVEAALIGEAFGALLQTARSRAEQLDDGAEEVARFQPKLLASAKETRALEVSAAACMPCSCTLPSLSAGRAGAEPRCRAGPVQQRRPVPSSVQVPVGDARQRLRQPVGAPAQHGEPPRLLCCARGKRAALAAAASASRRPRAAAAAQVIFFNGTPVAWYFWSSKGKKVLRKRGASITSAAIIESFSKTQVRGPGQGAGEPPTLPPPVCMP
jgi:hypothetical protein